MGSLLWANKFGNEKKKTISTEAIHIELLSLTLKINNISREKSNNNKKLIWVQFMKTTRKLRANDCSAMHRRRISMDRSSRYVENSSKNHLLPLPIARFHPQKHTHTHKHNIPNWNDSISYHWKTSFCYLSPSRDRRLCKEKKKKRKFENTMFVCLCTICWIVDKRNTFSN